MKVQIEAEGDPSIGRDGCPVGSKEVVVYPFFTPRKEFAWEHADVRAGVD